MSNGQQSLVWANVSEQRGGVSVSYAAFPSGRLGTLQVPNAGETTTLTSGSLAASLPGTGTTTLAGPEFVSALCP